MYVCMYVCMCPRTEIKLRDPGYVWIYMSMYVGMISEVPLSCMYVFMCVSINARIHERECACVYVRMYVHVRLNRFAVIHT
jgi:hypothetical protein